MFSFLSLSLSAYVAYVRTKFWRRAQKEKKKTGHTQKIRNLLLPWHCVHERKTAVAAGPMN